jgi:two-component system CheB/CheR fusion protein
MSSTPTDDEAQPAPDMTPAAHPPPANDAQLEPATPADKRVTFPVVGIGASEGGLEALEALIRRLSADRTAFVVVLHFAAHLAADADAAAEFLSRSTSLRVSAITDAMVLEAGKIYVAPAGAEVSVAGDRLHLRRDAEPRVQHQPIDAFFRALAHAVGPLAIGVILSGTGSDGTLGLKAIKDEGGITFAQAPSSAAQPGMPQSALDAGCADFSLTPAEIGEELTRVSAHPYVGRARTASLDDQDARGKIFTQLRSAFGVDFSLYKQSTVERRIGRRMALRRLDRIEEYLALLASDASELRGLYNDLLIGVTSFFRDAEPFEALKSVVFPRLLEHRASDQPVRVWVAGCATGEEAYSVGITLLEYLGDRAGSYSIQIFATDADEEALTRARSATYPPNIELDVSPERLSRFFIKTDKGYQVTRQVRDLIVFARHNLGKDPPFSRLDLVTCRNVLIYMQTPMQKKVLRIFHYALNPDAYLLLGTSESVGEAMELFSLIDRKLKIFVKQNTPATAVFDFSFWGRSLGEDEDDRPVPTDQRPMVNVAQVADRKVIEKYAPPGVIVDEKLEVVQFRGRTGRYLEPAPGVATLSLLKLVRPELLVSLRTTVQKTLSDGMPATSPAVPLWSEHGARAVALDVMPLPEAGGRKCLLVLFNEVSQSQRSGAGGEGDLAQGDPHVLELERELVTTKEYLQSTIEELEAANEELQSSNEELQSSNEELHSTNDELETSKEELQSTNEELATVNDELHNRMAQLSVANDDLRNVLANATSAIVIVGPDLRIRRFSAAAEKLLSLIPGDVGRPIAYLRNVMSARDIEQIAASAITSVTSREQRVRCIDGLWYSMRMVPYVTADHMIRGLVIEFAKTTPPAASEDAEVPALAQQVLSALPQAVMLLDRQLRLAWANRSFFEAFTVAPAAIGRPLPEVWGSATEPPELWAFLEEVASGQPARDVLIEHPFGRTAERPMRFSGRNVPSAAERPTLTLVVMQEV